MTTNFTYNVNPFRALDAPKIGESMNQSQRPQSNEKKLRTWHTKKNIFFALFATVSVHNWAIFKSNKK